MREMYDATILAHIHLVGLVDEYADYSQVESSIQKYRAPILREALGEDEYSGSALDRWKLVRDATFKKFRDGTMSVYVPLDDGKAAQKYENVCTSRKIKDETVTVNYPSFSREYRKTHCVLGTVFEDQPLFKISRTDPGRIADPLVVELACGYSFDVAVDTALLGKTAPSRNELGTRGFATNIGAAPYCVGLDSYTEDILFKVPALPALSLPYNPDDPKESEARRREVRCSISRAFYGVIPSDSSATECVPTTGDEFEPIVDGNELTATVKVSAHKGGGNAFHSKWTNVLETGDSSEPSDDDSELIPSIVADRIEHMSGALFFTYAWGWHTGFIQMPYLSIQELLSSTAYYPSVEGMDLDQEVLVDFDKTTFVSVSTTLDVSEETVETNAFGSDYTKGFSETSGGATRTVSRGAASDVYRKKQLLQQYRLLALLFSEEDDGAFRVEHFGLLTPEEARGKYHDTYDDRFDAYYGRALGNFLTKVPAPYRQR